MTRFQPRRAGIIGLWDYSDDEFVFADGWLILRGPNGSGKTKVLELLFPFLLDGNISPRRLNPFASQDRTMKSNLLFRGKDNGLGYAWMEFGDGELHTTIGVGMRVNKHGDDVRRWYFVAPGRVGLDFGLIDGDDRVLNRKDFSAQFPEGVVTNSQQDYRRMVNAALFGLDPDRYAQMIELILTLRRPQLAKELNPESLSSTLSEGLRPLDDSLITDAAKSFEDMEAVAKTLHGLRAADDKVAEFLRHYATYVRSQAKQAVVHVDARMTAVDDALTAEQGAATALTQAGAAVTRQREAVAEVRERLHQLTGELEGLKESEAYRSRRDLEDLRELVRQAETHDVSARARFDDAQSVRDAARTELEALLDDIAQTGSRVDGLAHDTGLTAEHTGLDWTFTDDAKELEVHSGSVAAQRDVDLRAVAASVDDLGQATRDRETAEQTAAKAADHESAAEAAVGAAVTDATAKRESLSDAVRGWAGEHRATLTIDLDDTVVTWVDDVTSQTHSSLREAVTHRLQPVLEDTIAEGQRLASARQLRQREREGHNEERERIAAEHDDAPPRPRWRGDDLDREPLWKLVRFKTDVRDGDAAALESALESAGILDSLIGVESEALDSSLRSLPEHARPAAPTLADFLECEDDVDANAASAVLASIAVRDHAANGEETYSVVDRFGRFAHGAVTGRAAKSAPEFIGATARAHRRHRRLAELDTAIEELSHDIDRLTESMTACDRHREAMRASVAALPSTDELMLALRTIDDTRTVLAERHRTAAEAQTALTASIEAQQQRRQQLQDTERRHRLRADDLEVVKAGLSRFREQITGLGNDLRHLDNLRARRPGRETEVANRESSLLQAEQESSTASTRHSELRSRLTTIEGSMDDDATTIFDRVDALTRTVEGTQTEVNREAGQLRELEHDQTRAETRSQSAADKTVDAIGEARAAAVELRPFAVDDVLRILNCPDHLRWPVDGQVADRQVLPEVVAQLLAAMREATVDVSPSQASVKSMTTRVNNAINDIATQLPATGMDHQVHWDNATGLITVVVDADEGRKAIGDYAALIHRQRLEQEDLLTQREQAVLEDALLTSLTSQIHQRMLESRDLVDRMDTFMRERQTSSGIGLGVSWVLSSKLAPEQRDIFKLLDGPEAQISVRMPQIRQYFAERIKQRRAETKAEVTYRDLLRESLDYRQWREFEFTLLRGGTSSRLTKRVHSQLSGGEQSLTLHLPLFAAANAVFSSADERAPRMIALDEAFAGVDDNGRAELMGLAAKFDLQLIMTGYDLFATVPEVAGASHYSLSHDDTNALVSSVLMVWNGTTHDEITDYDGSLVAALGSPNTRAVPSG